MRRITETCRAVLDELARDYQERLAAADAADAALEAAIAQARACRPKPVTWRAVADALGAKQSNTIRRYGPDRVLAKAHPGTLAGMSPEAALAALRQAYLPAAAARAGLDERADRATVQRARTEGASWPAIATALNLGASKIYDRFALVEVRVSVAAPLVGVPKQRRSRRG